MTGKSQINTYVPGLLLVVSFSHYKNYLHVIKETRKGRRRTRMIDEPRGPFSDLR